jgi:hypothetical protein
MGGGACIRPPCTLVAAPLAAIHGNRVARPVPSCEKSSGTDTLGMLLVNLTRYCSCATMYWEMWCLLFCSCASRSSQLSLLLHPMFRNLVHSAMPCFRRGIHLLKHATLLVNCHALLCMHDMMCAVCSSESVSGVCVSVRVLA